MYVRSMVEAGVLEGLAAVSPGPELSAALDALDPPPWCRATSPVEVLRAQARQCAHEQARLWATMVEVGLAVYPPSGGDAYLLWYADRPGGPDWAPGEIAAPLTWTAPRRLPRARAWPTSSSARSVVPAALSAGEIDRGKAVVFADHLDPPTGSPPRPDPRRSCAPAPPGRAAVHHRQLRGRLCRALLASPPGGPAAATPGRSRGRRLPRRSPTTARSPSPGPGCPPTRRPLRAPGSTGSPKRPSGPGTPVGRADRRQRVPRPARRTVPRPVRRPDHRRAAPRPSPRRDRHWRHLGRRLHRSCLDIGHDRT